MIGLGLATRKYGCYLPSFVAEYAGDTLWGLVVFLVISGAVPNAGVANRGAYAFAFAITVEVSQLYQADWINHLRRTTLGGLLLGFGFLWSDIACYASGISIGIATDYLLNRSRNNLSTSIPESGYRD